MFWNRLFLVFKQNTSPIVLRDMIKKINHKNAIERRRYVRGKTGEDAELNASIAMKTSCEVRRKHFLIWLIIISFRRAQTDGGWGRRSASQGNVRLINHTHENFTPSSLEKQLWQWSRLFLTRTSVPWMFPSEMGVWQTLHLKQSMW